MSTPTVVPAIVKTVTVPLDPAAAFELFTARMGDWWPLHSHSVGGAGSQGVVLRPTAAVETLPDGSTATWGEVQAWQPPVRLSMPWHPGATPGPDQTEVTVTFEPVPEGTRVRLEHSGWERLAPGHRGDYDSGWDTVLAGFVASA